MHPSHRRLSDDHFLNVSIFSRHFSSSTIDKCSSLAKGIHEQLSKLDPGTDRQQVTELCDTWLSLDCKGTIMARSDSLLMVVDLCRPCECACCPLQRQIKQKLSTDFMKLRSDFVGLSNAAKQRQGASSTASTGSTGRTANYSGGSVADDRRAMPDSQSRYDMARKEQNRPRLASRRASGHVIRVGCISSQTHVM